MSENQPPEPPAFGAPQQPPYQPPPYGYPPPVPQQGRRLPADQERTWASAAHWSALVASVVGGLAFLGPLIVMLTKGNESVWVRRQAVESLNFQLSVLIYCIVSAVLVLVLIGFVLLMAVVLLWLAFTIVAAIKTANGEDFRYPLTIRMVS